MNVLSDEDLKEYFKQGQMYVRKEVVNYNFQTIFKEKTVYDIIGIAVEWVNDDTVICEIFFDKENVKVCNFHRTCTKLALYAELKTLFIPVSEMYEAWNRS